MDGLSVVMPAYGLWTVESLASTPPGMPGTHPHQYYYVRSDIADQY